MSKDIRPQHRKSAQWVIKRLMQVKTQNAISDLVNVNQSEETYV